MCTNCNRLIKLYLVFAIFQLFITVKIIYFPLDAYELADTDGWLPALALMMLLIAVVVEYAAATSQQQSNTHQRNSCNMQLCSAHALLCVYIS